LKSIEGGGLRIFLVAAKLIKEEIHRALSGSKKGEKEKNKEEYQPGEEHGDVECRVFDLAPFYH